MHKQMTYEWLLIALASSQPGAFVTTLRIFDPRMSNDVEMQNFSVGQRKLKPFSSQYHVIDTKKRAAT